MRGQFALAIGAAAVAATGIPALWFLTFGPLATHMALHIALMNVAMPLLAMLLVRLGVGRNLGSKWLWGSTVLQLAALWGLHVPSAVSDAAALPVFLWTLLLASAAIFWLSVCSARPARWWHAILALLVTGKLACLLGALLVFAPRPLYAAGHHGFNLADQQMAGLLMLAACPLSYVLTGIIIAAQTLFRLGERTRAGLGRLAPARQTA